ncbi:hypothetical protein ABVK25_005129 [Lepraria finkii]|uniref:Uncharacterized protein n=1 Tax=Lepraria finkii TaxID=1340010 RepID=A0ABR4BB00_9LECA
MFLVEDDAKAILYTGNIRSKLWWVNSLIRNPVVLPYTHGHKRLDKIYLDTTFATNEGYYGQIRTKSARLAEQLEVPNYFKETVNSLDIWVRGGLDCFIKCPTLPGHVHVDQYKCRFYRSLACITAGEIYS